MLSPAALLLALAPIAAPAPAAAHATDVDTRLGYLVGDWTIQGLSLKTFRRKCAWSGRRAFVICSFQDQRNGTVGEAIFGYSEAQRRFNLYQWDSGGRGVYQLGFPSGRFGIVFTDERVESDGSARIQATLNLEDEGLRYTQYRSVEGRPWQRTADFYYVPAVQKRSSRKRRG
jgi:hypothetical protein